MLHERSIEKKVFKSSRQVPKSRFSMSIKTIFDKTVMSVSAPYVLHGIEHMGFAAH